MMMRRCRFVEEGLTTGMPETEHVATQTRQNFKLWHRSDVVNKTAQNLDRFRDIIAQEERLPFPGLADILKRDSNGHCDSCSYRKSYGTGVVHQFGGVQLCDNCKAKWRGYVKYFLEHVRKGFRKWFV